MILIMSIKEDGSTNDILQWLNFYNIDFIRLDYHEVFKLDKIFLSDDNFKFTIRSRNKIIDINEIDAFWYRRGKLNLFEPTLSIEKSLKEKIYNHLNRENSIIEEYFYFVLKDIPHIGSFEKHSVNKLEVLFEAKKVGLNIPSTLITEKKEDVINLLNKNIITKSIYENFGISTNNNCFSTYTELVEDFNKNVFFSSLFQKNIIKECDIRSFFLCGKFYSMAILSQNSNQTKIDFRKYDRDIPSRKFPISLPEQIESKLKILMQNVKLKTGSIDLILDKKGVYTFLEINPIGQFGMTSYPCNYYLEKKIANTLIKISKNG